MGAFKQKKITVCRILFYNHIKQNTTKNKPNKLPISLKNSKLDATYLLNPDI